MTKGKRTNQKKTHPKLYQNKRSLAYLHRNFDTIKVAVHLFCQSTEYRCFMSKSETIAFAIPPKNSPEMGDLRFRSALFRQKENDSKVIVDFCNETLRFRVHF